jgi:hypothetical protein
MKQAAKLCESEAFEILAERHRGTALSIFAIVAGRGDEPDRATVKCSKCGATFEFHSDGGWHLTEKLGADRFDRAAEHKAVATAQWRSMT